MCGIMPFVTELQSKNADVAQLVEQLIRNQQVRGSSPLISSISGRIAQLVRAPASHAGGRRFESVCVHQSENPVVNRRWDFRFL